MSLTISIRFLTGRANLHPWQTHHSEGHVEWPPSPWRLLRALVAVAGRGLTSLPYPDDAPPSRPNATVAVQGISSLKKRGVPGDAGKKVSLSECKQTLPLKESLTDAEAAAWKTANPGDAFAMAPDQLRELAAAPDPVAMANVESDEIALSRLAGLLHRLSTTPTIWLPKTAGGHTRQYFPIHDAGAVKPTGSAVFDTFATVRKDQPVLFHWEAVELSEQQLSHLRLLLSRITYFGRAESWCRAEAHMCQLNEITAEGMSQIVPQKTHWECRCIEDYGKPNGQEYRDYLLERRLAPVADLKFEVPELLPRTNSSDGKKRKPNDAETLKALLADESAETLLLRCLLRESGQDIKDGLERPIGTRWVHYAVPRAIYDVPCAKPQPRPRTNESVDLVRYALNTATVGRAVLPAVTDTLLVADRFRSAVMALRRQPSAVFSGHEPGGAPCNDHQHAFWLPIDEDNDGFIDHVLVYAPGGFPQPDIDALRRLTRLRQRGGRPDLLVTPTFVGRADAYAPWSRQALSDRFAVFVSATPFFCPVHLHHGRGRGGRKRSLAAQVRRSLLLTGTIKSESEIDDISEIVFDYAPRQLAEVLAAGATKALQPPLPRAARIPSPCYTDAFLKGLDDDYCFGSTIGLRVDRGNRLIRAQSFCRRRRGRQLPGPGRMLQITFAWPRSARPFAIGGNCHFGMGLFVPCHWPVTAQQGDK